MSGYVPCACRDCFDLAISATDASELCLLCKDAGCTPQGETGAIDATSVNAYEECQRPDAYSDDWEDEIHDTYGDYAEATYDPDTHPWDRLEEMNGHA